MNISVLTVFPHLYDEFLKTSLVGRAQEQGIVSCATYSFFSYVNPKERIDAPTFGHNAGMVIKPLVVEDAINDIEKKHGKAFKIFFSPRGKRLNQPVLHNVAQVLQERKHVLCIAGRYEGMDERVEEEYADLIISLGDFVIMGGDLPAMVLLEGFMRLLPGVVGKKESILEDSFQGPFVDYPSYTEPVMWHDKEVPPVLRSGNHKEIKAWQEKFAAEKSVYHHFSWLRGSLLDQKQKEHVRSHIPAHYVALMHGDVLLPNNVVGTTSVTSIDIHDIARSAKTYGLQDYFIVTPLIDQQKIVETILEFWHEGPGYEYNKQRYEAVRLVNIQENLEKVISAIEEKEGVKPLIIATSARTTDHANSISYFDQEIVWQHKRPVLFLLGTGKGLSENLIKKADFLLVPIEGFTDFNHLSVRSAAAIIFDRWLGLQPRSQF